MSIHFPAKRQPALSETDVRRIVREIVRSEMDIRIETLENLREPVPEPPLPGLVKLAFDAFDTASFAVALVAAPVFAIAKSVVR